MKLSTTAVLHEYKSKYNNAQSELSACDKQTQDILHKLELEKLTSAERSKLATLLSRVRKDRRYWKDITDAYQPLVDLDNSREPIKVGSVANALSKSINFINNINERNYKVKTKIELIPKAVKTK